MSGQQVIRKYSVSVKDQYLYFSELCEAHRKDLTGGLWTNMTLVGVGANGTSSSVKVIFCLCGS